MAGQETRKKMQEEKFEEGMKKSKMRKLIRSERKKASRIRRRIRPSKVEK